MNKSPPVVSVIMNCYNCREFLADAINSVYNQTYKNWEIIFWDNASIDDVELFINNYDDRLKYYRSNKNTSLGEARGNALSKTTGKYISFLDTDDLWLPRKLELQVELMESNDDIGMVYSDTMFFNSMGDQYNYFSVVTPRRGDVAEYLIQKGFISTETLMVRKKSLDDINFLFNKKYTVIMDYDLNIRLALNAKVDYVDEILSKWRIHSNNASSKLGFVIYHEIEEMLDRISNDNGSFSQNYKKSIALRKKRNNYHYGIEEWSLGKRVSAIKFIYNCDKKIARFFIIPIVILFNVSAINYLHKFRLALKTKLSLR